jgi:hypothetical protein
MVHTSTDGLSRSRQMCEATTTRKSAQASGREGADEALKLVQ